jgi:two-component system, NtrC family, response regulator
MAHFLIVDDDSKIVQFLCEMVESWGHSFDRAYSLKECLALSEQNYFDIVLLDLELPDGNAINKLPDITRASSKPEVIIITGTGGLNGAKLAFKYGVWDFVQKPFIMEEVFLPVSRALEYRKEKKETKPVILKHKGIIGESAIIHSCLDNVAKASRTNVSVLITGETGTGKELFARAIHQNSRRSKGAFIPINCGTIPASLAESIFFGHEKGAFTGAENQKEGVIRQADNGVLFLDEIGDLPMSIQKSLLRVLQEKCIRPIGSKKEIKVDFQLVSATNRNLKRMVAEKLFRQDFLFRINSMTIELPPLRERGGDLEEIAINQIRKICQEYNIEIKGIAPEFLEILKSNYWPGNVRELINVLEAAIAAVGPDPTLYPKHLPPEYRTAALRLIDEGSDGYGKITELDILSRENIQAPEAILTLAEYRLVVEKQYLERILKKAKRRRKEICQILDISQAGFYELLKKHNLSLKG